MESIQSILKLIGDYGIMFILCAVFIYVLIKLINIFFVKVEEKIYSKNHDEKLDHRTQIGIKIQSMIDAIISSTEIAHIEVVEFSNSVMSVANLPFKYLTCTYESMKLGEQAIGSKVDHISTSLYTSLLVEMGNSDRLILHENNADDERKCSHIFDVVNRNNVVIIANMMTTISGKNIGFVSAQKRDGLEFSEDELVQIDGLSAKVCALLSVYDK